MTDVPPKGRPEAVEPVRQHVTDEQKRRAEDAERVLLNRIEGSRKEFSKSAKENLFWDRALGAIVVACGIAAPLTVVGATGSVLTLPSASSLSQILAWVSAALTFITGAAETIRRTYAIGQKWRFQIAADEQLQALVNDYQINQIHPEVAQPKWVENLKALEASYNKFSQRSFQEYLDTMRAMDRKASDRARAA